MKKNILSIWQCPECKSHETDLSVIKEDDEIMEGEIICAECKKRFSVSKGIIQVRPVLSVGMADEIKKVRQKTVPEKGLVFPLKENIAVNDQWLLCLPTPYFHAGMWNSRLDIDFIINETGLKKNDKALDLGAGVCWTTRELAKACENCVALDILNDKYTGLESAKVYIENSGDYFERVNAEMESLPFRDSSFDFILTNCSAHHAESLFCLFSEIMRALKPGGKYAISNELTQGMLKKSPLEGNDHFYTIADYVRELKNVGFGVKLFLPASIHAALSENTLRRKAGGWKLLGKLCSLVYSIPLFQTLVRKNIYLLSRIFGIPLIIISTKKR